MLIALGKVPLAALRLIAGEHFGFVADRAVGVDACVGFCHHLLDGGKVTVEMGLCPGLFGGKHCLRGVIAAQFLPRKLTSRIGNTFKVPALGNPCFDSGEERPIQASGEFILARPQTDACVVIWVGRAIDIDAAKHA